MARVRVILPRQIGLQFGRPRPATGFSTDLKTLIGANGQTGQSQSRVYAPAGSARGLLEAIAAIRRSGGIVVQQLPGQLGDAREMGCDKRLTEGDSGWVVVDLERD